MIKRKNTTKKKNSNKFMGKINLNVLPVKDLDRIIGYDATDWLNPSQLPFRAMSFELWKTLSSDWKENGTYCINKTVHKKKLGSLISIKHRIICGLDVHKNKISACILKHDLINNEDEVEIKEFKAFTKDLLQLKQWILGHKCQTVYMESTGVYWCPVHNILENELEVCLVNARHIKKVPGRKTDISDAVWLAAVARCGLINSSFIPPKQVRQWRDLITDRQNLVDMVKDHKRRVHKLFQTANIKIDSVVTDLFGVTGRNLMNLLANGEKITKKDVRESAKGSLKKKVGELVDSVNGFFNSEHKWRLNNHLQLIDLIQEQINDFEQRLFKMLEPHNDLINRLSEIPGVDKINAISILAHLGPTLESFENEAALANWCGLCPGNTESAGQRKTGRSPVKKHPFKKVMVGIGWSAMKKKGSYYRAKYYNLKARRGPQRAIVGVAHRVSKAVFHIIAYGESYREVGGDYLENLSEKKRIAKMKKQAEKMGFKLVAA